jgi:DHA2 family multidrug resistance protein
VILTQYFLGHGISDPAIAQHEAIIAVGNIVRHQASIMGYGDMFFLLGAALILALVASLFLKKTAAAGQTAAH